MIFSYIAKHLNVSFEFNDAEEFDEYNGEFVTDRIHNYQANDKKMSVILPKRLTYYSVCGYYAFEGCNQVTIATSENSCAEKYAREHGLAVELI